MNAVAKTGSIGPGGSTGPSSESGSVLGRETSAHKDRVKYFHKANRSRVHWVQDRVVCACLCWTDMFLLTMLTKSFQGLVCTQGDDGNYRLRIEMSVLCWYT